MTGNNEIDDSLGHIGLSKNLHGDRKLCSVIQTLASVHNSQEYRIETSNKTPNQVHEHFRLLLLVTHVSSEIDT